MGNEESEAKPVEIINVKTVEKTARSATSDVPPIPVINPLIARSLISENYPKDLNIPPGKLPAAQAEIKDYFSQLTYHLNKNEEIIAKNIARQMDQYSSLNVALEKRKDTLNVKLDEMLKTFQSLDDDIKEATNSLSNFIQRADKLAQIIDPSLPSFEEYKKN
ncbi:hypothetical protein TVAG_169480 [Trichomonas vaginalis G3]|uniref:Uncharacterized protein n=1 Tax=Trichomonas vaginalis (strain ATCC PRA-98 / G3) TaxID=412133 RepID=A2G6A4_TRIV3|nr:hypothetical protein TVAGG3_0584800 [Trichomonas vaginalis G3]EAX87315.1 hypothetical protein TVAG_169480 [Trichomonas vaginalis G3]KAI5522811.1 hypothetical protein TVAGG3_0584800 [Trichomonas vaginalis G3]|eukprot:XP_001300245.1 hypothetical protein [Trichomonas vaginalis G3]